MSKYLIVFGLLLLAAPAFSAFTDTNLVLSTGKLGATGNAGATAKIAAWKDNTIAYFQVETSVNGDFFLSFGAAGSSGLVTADAVRLSVAGNTCTVLDGTIDTSATPANNDFAYTTGGAGVASDTTNDWSLVECSVKTAGFKVEFKRNLAKPADSADKEITASNNAVAYRLVTSGYPGTAPTASTVIESGKLGADPKADTQTLVLSAKLATAYTFSDPTSTGVAAGRLAAAVTNDIAVKAALYKMDSTTAKLSFTASKDGTVLFAFGGESVAKPFSAADVLKVKLLNGAVTMTEGTSTAVTGNNVITAITYTDPATKWTLADAGSATAQASSFWDGIMYKVELKRTAAAAASATPGQNKAITFDATPTIAGVWASKADVTGAVDAPTATAGLISGSSVTVKETTATDATTPSSSGSGSGSNANFITATLMLVVSIGLVAF